jgi:hypothetical protein
MKTYVIDDDRSIGPPKFDVDNRLNPRRVTLKFKLPYYSLNTDLMFSSHGTK